MKKLFLTLAVVIAFAGVISCACNNNSAEEATEEEATECCCDDDAECECEEACEAPAEAE